MLSFSQVVEVTREEARQELLEVLEEIGFPATSWQEGSISLGLVEIGSWLWSKASTLSVYLKGAGLNDTATGDSLTRFSKSHYQNIRREAVTARRLLTLACADGEGPHTLQPGTFRAGSATGYEFDNIADPDGTYPAAYPLTIEPGETAQIIVEAQIPGEGPNGPSGTVVNPITIYAGITITADAPHRTGVNEESNESLQLRNSLKWALLPAMGLIDDSVEALARDAVAAVDRVVVNSNNPRGAGTLDVWVTGAQGSLSSDELATIKAAIQQRIMHDPDSDALQVDNAPLEPLDLAVDVYYRSGHDWEIMILPAIEAALETWRRTIPLGGFPYPEPGSVVPLNEVETTIRKVQVSDTEPVRTVKITSPATDVPVTTHAHVTRGTWTFTPKPVA